MKLVNVADIEALGLPLYDMRKIFNVNGDFSTADISFITIMPGQRVPQGDGWSLHDSDEYSIFISGEVYTKSGDFDGVAGKGQATFIPKGEKHWCENRTNEPCTLVCVMLK